MKNVKMAIIAVLMIIGLFAGMSSHAAGKIAFSSNQSGSYQIWVMNDDGTEREQITDENFLQIKCYFIYHFFFKRGVFTYCKTNFDLLSDY